LGKRKPPQAQPLADRLAEGMDLLGLPYDGRHLQTLLRFLNLLRRWNGVFNLTSVNGIEQMVSAHLLDSLAGALHLTGESVIDVGTGGGLPGVPLALAAPERRFVLLDSNAKKTRFVQQVAIELELENVTVVHGRVEALADDESFDTVVTRAFARLADTISRTGHLVAPGGRLLAWKGRSAFSEVKAVPEHLVSHQQCQVVHLQVPGIKAERYLVRWSPSLAPA
jgi:16S rRNA (guanine527-N7)-methyltransferase